VVRFDMRWSRMGRPKRDQPLLSHNRRSAT
jgi:hypothetical protein